MDTVIATVRHCDELLIPGAHGAPYVNIRNISVVLSSLLPGPSPVFNLLFTSYFITSLLLIFPWIQWIPWPFFFSLFTSYFSRLLTPSSSTQPSRSTGSRNSNHGRYAAMTSAA